MSMRVPLYSDRTPARVCKRGARFPQAPRVESPGTEHGTPMRPSFAHIVTTQHARTCGLVIVFALASVMSGCASLPPPTGELAAAQQAVARAESADADQYASAELASARSALGAAQSAMARGDEDQARLLAESASTDGELALARSRAATTQA